MSSNPDFSIPKGAYAVIFTSRTTPEAATGDYAAMAAMLDRLVADQPGFLGMESTRGADGLGITVSYWESREAIAAWRSHPDHLDAIRRGMGEWYEHFSVTVAQVERSHTGP